MNFAKTLAPLALLALCTSAPVLAAKEAKVPRCNGQSKRPANPYGTILPSLPARSATVPTSAPAPTQFFPSSTAPTEKGSAAKKEAVPPISEARPLSTAPVSAPQPVYASC
ncbi:hypothetical protein GG804_19150 [Sphingomonas histidinilytica]|uniref:hypothetical protein n=1 Tax=Rhizorhabdus histidinilytica TaxID=439228 RepID=UPI001ADCCB89|nr:hypothetical protein [Rhizorhabdus histidinilytica]MBO9378888.1 hypothetical protein [Rhizorhabdus histidinilytica]